MSAESEAIARARLLDSSTRDQAERAQYANPNYLARKLRVVLQDSRHDYSPAEVWKLVRADSARVRLGPGLFKGPAPDQFLFLSGARLVFSIQLAEHQGAWHARQFSFHLQFPGGPASGFVRVCLRNENHEQPLIEPLCHVHPGNDEIRVPCSLTDPLEVLERLCFAWANACGPS